MKPLPEGTVLLFYEDFDRDRWFRGSRHVVRRLRAGAKRVTGGQRTTGFEVWFNLLVRALRRAGRPVRVNDYRAARAHPEHPVGIAGYPHILDGWSLPNPAVLGPGLLDHPNVLPDLMRDERFRAYLVTCEWVRAMFEPCYGDACVDWHAGIDLDEWPDTTGLAKDIDVLVYDKVRWAREEMEPCFLLPVLGELQARGLRIERVRYGRHNREQYRRLLRRSRSMLFLCEHETQGLAYQEALASGLPVLAWDNGWWLDPRRPQYTPDPVPASSVPYFDADCGERFRDLDDFVPALDRFLDCLAEYRPRDYVARELSLEASACAYLAAYDRLAPSREPAVAM